MSSAISPEPHRHLHRLRYFQERSKPLKADSFEDLLTQTHQLVLEYLYQDSRQAGIDEDPNSELAEKLTAYIQVTSSHKAVFDLVITKCSDESSDEILLRGAEIIMIADPNLDRLYKQLFYDKDNEHQKSYKYLLLNIFSHPGIPQGIKNELLESLFEYARLLSDSDERNFYHDNTELFLMLVNIGMPIGSMENFNWEHGLNLLLSLHYYQRLFPLLATVDLDWLREKVEEDPQIFDNIFIGPVTMASLEAETRLQLAAGHDDADRSARMVKRAVHILFRALPLLQSEAFAGGSQVAGEFRSTIEQMLSIVTEHASTVRDEGELVFLLDSLMLINLMDIFQNIRSNTYLYSALDGTGITQRFAQLCDELLGDVGQENSALTEHLGEVLEGYLDAKHTPWSSKEVISINEIAAEFFLNHNEQVLLCPDSDFGLLWIRLVQQDQREINKELLGVILEELYHGLKSQMLEAAEESGASETLIRAITGLSA